MRGCLTLLLLLGGVVCFTRYTLYRDDQCTKAPSCLAERQRIERVEEAERQRAEEAKREKHNRIEMGNQKVEELESYPLLNGTLADWYRADTSLRTRTSEEIVRRIKFVTTTENMDACITTTSESRRTETVQDMAAACAVLLRQ